jgi:two-component system phosphate regulon response regulator PhoB
MSQRIMIVEDDHHVATLLRYNLEAAGFVVEHHVCGRDIVRRIEEEAPDLVLLDWMLPGISGIELCRRIRRLKDGAELPIIMLTARTANGDGEFARMVGANAFLTKPFEISEVLSKARCLLDPEARRGSRARVSVTPRS